MDEYNEYVHIFENNNNIAYCHYAMLQINKNVGARLDVQDDRLGVHEDRLGVYDDKLGAHDDRLGVQENITSILTSGECIHAYTVCPSRNHSPETQTPF